MRGEVPINAYVGVRAQATGGYDGIADLGRGYEHLLARVSADPFADLALCAERDPATRALPLDSGTLEC
jgi:hypothetical protein